MSLKEKNAAVLKLGEELKVKGADVKEEGRKLIIKGLAEYGIDRDHLWDLIKKQSGWEKDVVADIKVEKTEHYGYWTVKPGESLSKIAKDVYDDGNKYMKIFEANEDQLKVAVVREHPRELVLGFGLRLAQNALFYIYTVFVLSYGEKTLGYSRTTMLTGVAIASFVGLFSTPLWGHLSYRVGRRPVYLTGTVISLLYTLPFFWLLGQGSGLAVWLAIVLGLNVGHDLMYGPAAAYFSELFGPHVRYTGASMVYQESSVFSGGLAPLLATWLLARFGH